MRSILLGSGTSVPSARRASPGVFIVGKGYGILIDPSSGTLTRLARAGFMPTAVDTILVTHFHPDHVVDLVPILFSLRSPRFEAERRWPRLVGPEGFARLYEKLRAPFEEWIPRAPEEIELVEWSGEWPERGPFRLTAAEVAHHRPCLAYRISTDEGEVVFSGDTEECEEIVALARQADLLFLECSFPLGSRVAGHLDPAVPGVRGWPSCRGDPGKHCEGIPLAPHGGPSGHGLGSFPR